MIELTEHQHRVFNAFAANPMTVVSFPRQHGASTVLKFMAADTAKSGKRVLVIEPTLYGYETMRHELRRAPNVKVVLASGTKLDADHEHYDCILLDSAELASTSEARPSSIFTNISGKIEKRGSPWTLIKLTCQKPLMPHRQKSFCAKPFPPSGPR